MAKVRLRPIARDEIKSIRRYLKRNSPIAAIRFSERIATCLEQLAVFPKSGKIFGVSEWETREIVIGQYRLIYEIIGCSVEVVRVFHSSMDVTCENFKNPSKG